VQIGPEIPLGILSNGRPGRLVTTREAAPSGK